MTAETKEVALRNGNRVTLKIKDDLYRLTFGIALIVENSEIAADTLKILLIEIADNFNGDVIFGKLP